MRKKISAASRLYIALIFLFLYAPIFVLILFSFNDSTSTSVWSGFSLRWYEAVFQDEAAMSSLKNTLILAVVSAAAATALGAFAALGIDAMHSKIARSAVMTVTNIPMMNPDIVTGISMMLLFVFAGSLVRRSNTLGFSTLLIAHITFNLPYVILSVLPRLKQMDKHLEEAALDLGCTQIQSLFKVVIPNIMPGIITGFIMAFTLSLDDFVISYFTNGPSFETLPVLIYSMTKKRVKPDMYALSVLMFVVVLALLVIYNISLSRSNAEQNKKNKEKR